MPNWEYPQETILGENVTRGLLSTNFTIQSQATNLNYLVQYKVYTPAGYESLSNLPVIYVTDGHEYSNEQMGSMLTVLDNLIHSQTIKPIIAVFIDPRNPSNLSENRRGSEYTANDKFANFVADELVPAIDAAYKTNSNPSARAILGTSLGGWNAAFFGYKQSDTFQLIAIHSPAFNNAIIQAYQSSPLLPLKIFMSTGVIHDTESQARSMKSVMDQKGYPLLYKEVNEGHSWGNWRALLEEPLVYFFGN
jgi:enterochelin esterase family protein